MSETTKVYSPQQNANGQPLGAVADGSSDRDKAGRFTAGNKCGRGNPHARQLAAMRRAFTAAVTEPQLELLAQKMLAAALEGDWTAAKLLLSYTCGLPEAAPNPDRLDLDEIELFRQAPLVVHTIFEDSKPRMAPQLAAEHLRDGTVCTPDEYREEIDRLLDEKAQEKKRQTLHKFRQAATV
jgi:hypothetical protein